MKTLLATLSLLATLLAHDCAFAQTSTPNASLFTSSPSPTVGASIPVAPVGIPMGATELAVPGLSPPPTGSIGNGCSTTGGTTGSTGSGLFDGGGMASTGSIGCMQSGSSTGASTTIPSLTAGQGGPTGPAGIPLGSTELSNAGLSPPPPLTTINIPTTAFTMPPTSTATSSGVVSMPSTSPCTTTGTFGGVTTPGQSTTTTTTASGC